MIQKLILWKSLKTYNTTTQLKKGKETIHYRNEKLSTDRTHGKNKRAILGVKNAVKSKGKWN